MRLSFRFILPLVVVLTLVAYTLVPVVDRLTYRWFQRDLEIRAKLIANSIQDSLVTFVRDGSTSKVNKLFDRVTRDDRLYALGFCDTSGKLLYKTSTYPDEILCEKALNSSEDKSYVLHLSQGDLHVGLSSIEDDDVPFGRLVLVHDMSFIQKRSSITKKYIFYLFVILVALVSLITVLIAQLSWKGWIKGLRSLLKGERLFKLSSNVVQPELRPFLKDLRGLIRDLETDRRARDANQVSWSPSALKEILQKELAGDEILIVSNREPYIHFKKGENIEVQVPASGLVTALEPIMRACSGTWIAHGSGNADREVVDKHDHVRVPPENPSYQIRRVWLSQEEESGYYYGFANEGLWPLCHIAHTRPIFRSEDWRHYVEVNRKFAEAVIQEAKTDDPVILVQDYHFALLPKMVKEALPKATIITFWHIPWPNPEAFGICPWREEILDGLLGSSILGFHTRFHCNNFLDSVDRFMECRIDRDTSTISYGSKVTAVNQYPISIEWPVRWLKSQKSLQECHDRIRKINGMPAHRRIGIGVDRLDYTKGILERFLAVERLLEINPDWIGKFTFIQIAAPSRSNIEHYQQFESLVRSTVLRINRKFSREGYEPICLKIEHHEPAQVYEYFRGSDLCFVSSLHDGMNLVAKEFIAARDDERGVLILSQFTGASKELPEALVVNPYDIDQCAHALQAALEMSASEQRDRMKSMRGLIQEYNVYRWAGRMLIDAARVRQRTRFLGRFGNVRLKLPGVNANL